MAPGWGSRLPGGQGRPDSESCTVLAYRILFHMLLYASQCTLARGRMTKAPGPRSSPQNQADPQEGDPGAEPGVPGRLFPEEKPGQQDTSRHLLGGNEVRDAGMETSHRCIIQGVPQCQGEECQGHHGSQGTPLDRTAEDPEGEGCGGPHGQEVPDQRVRVWATEVK